MIDKFFFWYFVAWVLPGLFCGTLLTWDDLRSETSIKVKHIGYWLFMVLVVGPIPLTVFIGLLLGDLWDNIGYWCRRFITAMRTFGNKEVFRKLTEEERRKAKEIFK